MTRLRTVVTLLLVLAAAPALATEATLSLGADYVHARGATVAMLDLDRINGSPAYVSAVAWLTQMDDSTHTLTSCTPGKCGSPPVCDRLTIRDDNTITFGLGAGVLVVDSESWRIGFGGMYLNDETAVNYARLNLDVRVVWKLSKTWSATVVRHWSSPLRNGHGDDHGWNVGGVGLSIAADL